MNLEEKANKHADLQYPMSVEREFPIEDFKSGYIQCKSDLIEFLNANQKETVKQVLEHLNQMK